MKKILNTIFVFFVLLTIPQYSRADVAADCMQAITNDPDFAKVMTSEIFPNASELTQEYVTQRKSKIMGLIASETILHCMHNINTLVKRANGKVWYKRDGKTYAFQFKMPELFQYIDIPVGIMVYNKSNLSAGDVIELSDINKLYWSKECSDHVIWDNLDDDAAVNIAGQKVFSQYGGKKNEFFLDFEEGNNRRAFPGLVLMDKTRSSSEAIVAFTNLYTAVGAAEQFASALNNSPCSNDGLSVYVVNLETYPIASDNERAWAITAGVSGSAPLAIGVGLAKLAALGGTAWAGTAGFLAALNHPVGWAITGVVAIGAGVMALVPSKIQDIQQVMVLDGPYLIK